MNVIVFATNNKHKIDEAKNILKPFGYEVASPRDVGVKGFNPLEYGENFSENAIIKAKTLLEIIPEACIFADDSGLVVDALGGKPGVLSARYCEGTDNDRCLKILDEMKDKEDRKAAFVCSVAFYCKQFNFGLSAKCEGEISREIIGENGFGYDPIFIRNGKSFAELTQKEKNKCSHRAGKMVQMANFLNAVLKQNLFAGEIPITEILKNAEK